MHLLTQLPPPEMPQPLPYWHWKANVLATLPPCKKCDNTRRIECPECCGCGTWDECHGAGHQECSCTGGVRADAYLRAVANDYAKLLRHRGLVMPSHEIDRLAAASLRSRY